MPKVCQERAAPDRKPAAGQGGAPRLRGRKRACSPPPVFGRLLFRSASLRGWRADLAALALGVVSAAALPPLHVIPALLVAVPGLLALIDGARGPMIAARRGWWFGFGHHLIGLYWITEAILIEAARFWWFVPIAVPALSAVLALFIALPVGLARLASPGWPRLLALAGGLGTRGHRPAIRRDRVSMEPVG